MAQGCVFCRIVKGEVKGDILYRDDQCFVVRDLHPQAPVHLLVIPQEHLTYLSHLTKELEPVVGHLFAVAEEMAKREGIAAQGYRCVINQRDHAGQAIPHLHLHVLGGKLLGPLVR